MGGSSARIQVVASDDAGVTEVQVGVAEQLRPAVQRDGDWSATVPLPQGHAGLVEITVSATDGNGNRARLPHSLNIDTVAPVFALAAGQMPVGTSPNLVRVTSTKAVNNIAAVWNGAPAAVRQVTGSTDLELNVAAPSGATSVSLVISGTDALGNRGSNTLQVPVDVTRPGFTLVNNEWVTRQPKTIRFRSVLPVTMVTAQWFGQMQPITSLDGGEWSVSLAADAGIDGVSPLLVSGQGTSGNTGTSALDLNVDTAGPVLTLASPVADTTVGGDGVSNIVVVGQATDRNGIAALSVGLDGGELRSLGASDGGFTVSLPMPTGLDRVARHIRVEARDRFDNPAVLTSRVYVDVVGPTVIFNSPSADAVIGAETLDVDVSVVDASGVAGAAVELDGTKLQATLLSGAVWRRAVSLPAVDFVSKTLKATAQDAVGNTSLAVSRTISVDRVAPRLTISRPTGGQIFNATAATVTAEAAVTEGDPNRTYSWRLTYANGGTPVTSNATNFVITPRPGDNFVKYQLALEIRDRAGNLGTATAEFTVDNVAPTLTNLTPVLASRRNIDAQTIVATFSEPMAATPGLDFVPVATQGTWLDTSRYQAPAMAGWQRTSVRAQSATDIAGNHVVATTPVEFRTAAATPPDRASLAVGVSRFEVTSDADGRAMVAIEQLNRDLNLYAFDPGTGSLGPSTFQHTPRPSSPAAGFGIQLYSEPTASDPLNTIQRVGWMWEEGNAAVWEDGTLLSQEVLNDLRVLVTPAVPAETHQRVFATLYQDQTSLGYRYSRGGVDILPFAPSVVLPTYSNRTYVPHVAGGNLKLGYLRQRCTACPFEIGVGNFSTSSNDIVRPWNDHVRGAASRDGRCVVLSYPLNQTRRAVMVRPSTYDAAGACVGSNCDFEFTEISGISKIESSAFEHDKILVAADIGKISTSWPQIALHMVSSATTPGCRVLVEYPGHNLPTSEIRSPITGNYRIVQIGLSPVLLYITPSNELQVHRF